MLRVKARLISIGGGLLAGVVLVVLALAYVATISAGSSLVQRAVVWLILTAIALYLVDAWTEHLDLEKGTVIFDSLLKRRQFVDLDQTDEILLVFEGLNLEFGIWTIRFRRDAEERRFSLGALWHRRDLERFMRAIETAQKKRKLVEEVR